jgi:glutathione synthase/RimK-type ligase-like ATP-grasp enzyme
VAIKELPPAVAQAALAASRAAGPGLWGVDIKERGDEPYVIEINDNPNIDDDVEAAVEGDRVWARLAEWFAQQIRCSLPRRLGAGLPIAA